MLTRARSIPEKSGLTVCHEYAETFTKGIRKKTRATEESHDDISSKILFGYKQILWPCQIFVNSGLENPQLGL
jgi:hypothetical protein